MASFLVEEFAYLWYFVNNNLVPNLADQNLQLLHGCS